MDAAADGGAGAATTDAYERKGRGRVLAAIVILLLLVGAIAVFVFGAGRHRGESALDAAVPPADALVVIPATDASVDAAEVDAGVDASDEPDAGRSKKRDGGVPHPVDAASVTPAIDAGAKVTGTGFLTCTADPFANVSIDGADWGVTPFFKKKIAAGRHEVVFTNPASGAIVKRTTVDIAPGQAITVHFP